MPTTLDRASVDKLIALALTARATVTETGPTPDPNRQKILTLTLDLASSERFTVTFRQTMRNAPRLTRTEIRRWDHRVQLDRVDGWTVLQTFLQRETGSRRYRPLAELLETGKATRTDQPDSGAVVYTPA